MQNRPRCEHLWPHVASTELTRFGVGEVLKRDLASYFSSIASRTVTARAKLYDKYRREVGGYDMDFIKKHDEDLNTTLIFVSEEFVGHVE